MIRNWTDTHIPEHTNRWRQREDGTTYVMADSTFSCDVCEDGYSMQQARDWLLTSRTTYLCKRCAKQLGLVW